MPFLIIGLTNLTRNWSLFPNQLIHWDVNINLNNQYEVDYIQCIFPDLDQSQSVRWSVNSFNPFSLINSEWVKAYGSNAWNDRAAAWQLSGSFNYNLTGNLNENIPVDLNLNSLLVIPIRGSAALTLEKIASNVSGTVIINFIEYRVEDVSIAYKLSVTLVSPAPNINSINEILYFNKIDGTLLQSITTIDGTGIYGWSYNKTITVTQNYLFWIILLIILASCSSIIFVMYIKKRKTRSKIEEEI
ncbi:MAG: hypothetical protein EAX96_08795 [Candidatus Lokiarchaeota archaeon]|nr:hypothetical protein [Candidatus Lokiarchaeota archaeon]